MPKRRKLVPKQRFKRSIKAKSIDYPRTLFTKSTIARTQLTAITKEDDELTANIKKKLVKIYKQDEVEEILRPKRPKTSQAHYVNRPMRPSTPVSPHDVSRS